MNITLQTKIAFGLYETAWTLVTPALRYNARLREGFDQRTLKDWVETPVDIWIQAASVGEAFLAVTIAENITTKQPTRILLTSNTRQGLDIIKKEIAVFKRDNITLIAAYFPFDKPSLMDKAIKLLQPKVMVLLEAEIWPGLLLACKKRGVKTVLLNGRITPKSLSRYLVWPSLWLLLNPDTVLAMSPENKVRFEILFGREHVELMQNMKFDRLSTADSVPYDENTLTPIFPPDPKFIVLGSIRQEEEDKVAEVVKELITKHPNAIIGLFPRHMHRVPFWQDTLKAQNQKWLLRSAVNSQVSQGTIILWDTFGELQQAFSLADAVFIGGTLAPVGGQNFLEPLTCGIRPFIGPHWKNFDWVGREIIDAGLVHEVSDEKELCDAVSESLAKPSEKRGAVRKAALEYMHSRQGGTRKACQAIEKFL